MIVNEVIIILLLFILWFIIRINFLPILVLILINLINLIIIQAYLQIIHDMIHAYFLQSIAKADLQTLLSLLFLPILFMALLLFLPIFIQVIIKDFKKIPHLINYYHLLIKMMYLFQSN